MLKWEINNDFVNKFFLLKNCLWVILDYIFLVFFCYKDDYFFTFFIGSIIIDNQNFIETYKIFYVFLYI